MDGVSLNDALETGKDPSRLDAENAMAVYGDTPLGKLRPLVAADERVWAYLCHMDCPQYVARRWLKERPNDNKVAASRVRNHFFAKGNRGIIRDNAVSRLWWLGHIAHDVSPRDPMKFLRILLHRQDLRSALIERPSVSMNRRVLSAVYGIMEEYWDSPLPNGGHDRAGDASRLFVREVFRDWMIRLNRRGGVVLLDSLDNEKLVDLVRGEAADALASGVDGD